MTKEVLISISGLQYEKEEEELIEVISRGEYYQKNGKHYILYDEISGDNYNLVTKCTLKISKNQVEMIKNGEGHMHMVFELNQNNLSCYSTPYGELMIGVTTTSIDLQESDKLIAANLKYDLDINYEFASTCSLNISVRAN